MKQADQPKHQTAYQTMSAQSDRDLPPAQWKRKKSVEAVLEFEKELDDEQELSVRVFSSGGEVPFCHPGPTQIGFTNPHIVCFREKDPKGQQLKVTQHWMQLSVHFTAIKRPVEATPRPPHRIGFNPGGADE